MSPLFPIGLTVVITKPLKQKFFFTIIKLFVTY